MPQLLFPCSELCGLSRIFGFDVNFEDVVADNLQEARLDDLTVSSSLTPHTTGKYPTKFLSQVCHELVLLLLIMEMVVMLKCASFAF